MPEYQAVDPTGTPTERTTWAPHVFCNRAAVWEPILGGSIDEMTLQFICQRCGKALSNLLADQQHINEHLETDRFAAQNALDPHVVVLDDTYRGYPWKLGHLEEAPCSDPWCGWCNAEIPPNP